jgi:hypothetical protein
MEELHEGRARSPRGRGPSHLGDGVVAEAADIDTCLILGAGFPFWLGGITKHLDQTGVSEASSGRPLAEIGASAPARN